MSRWKYQHDLVLGGALSALLAAHRNRWAECYDILVPVPVHRSRLRSRGFNQAAVLARAVARPGERVALHTLSRRTATPSQAALGRRARAANVSEAFAVARPAVVRGHRVLLLDDVFTTGATARACSGELRTAGAALVDVLTLARTPRGPGRRLAAPGARAGAVEPATTEPR